MHLCIYTSIASTVLFPCSPPPIFSNMPPSFLEPPMSASLSEASNSSRPSHSYNIWSLDRSSSKDIYGIGIVPPLKPPNSAQGWHSIISKSIHQDGIDVVEGIQLTTDWVLIELSTLLPLPPWSGYPLTVMVQVARQKNYPSGDLWNLKGWMFYSFKKPLASLTWLYLLLESVFSSLCQRSNPLVAFHIRCLAQSFAFH